MEDRGQRERGRERKRGLWIITMQSSSSDIHKSYWICRRLAVPVNSGWKAHTHTQGYNRSMGACASQLARKDSAALCSFSAKMWHLLLRRPKVSVKLLEIKDEYKLHVEQDHLQTDFCKGWCTLGLIFVCSDDIWLILILIKMLFTTELNSWRLFINKKEY